MPGTEKEKTAGAGDALEATLARHGENPHALLQILNEVQEAEGWIPPAALTRIAERLNLPRARVEGVAGFYSFLHLKPAGRYRVRFSDNITDRMQGNQALFAALCEKLWVERGKASDDALVSVDFTSCIGLCDQGPALLVNGRAIPRLDGQRLDRVADLILQKRPLEDWPADLFRIDDNIRRRGLLLGSPHEPGAPIHAAIGRGAEGMLDEIKTSGLRGRGGAGFPTGLKWEGCRNAPGRERYVVCNADEGEPGTFKDRVLLARHADLLFDGMTVAAWVTGARHGFVYLRGEYRNLLAPLDAALARRRAAGLLGGGICGKAGFDFDIAIHLGAGAYVCGEESALIESLEGKRGIPRNRPPFPVTHGYLQQPTLVNNVETFCAAAHIAVMGGDTYRAVGTAKSAGTKLISVSGDCARPGVYEYPFGVTVRQVLDDCGAGSAGSGVQAVQISGPSGICIAADELDRRIAFEDLPLAGAFTVFDETRDMFEVARHYTHFFAHESCGFCTPCRVGTAMLRDIMDKIGQGKGGRRDLDEIHKLGRLLAATAHCGLGHSACNPVSDTLRRFLPSYERRLRTLSFKPAFDLDGALAEARRMTGRDDVGAHFGAEEAP